MASQVVEFVVTRTEVTKSYLPDTYQLREDRRHVWLQRLALWVLRKLGAYAISENVNYTRCRVDTREFLQGILQQNHELLDLYHHKGERLLVGYEEFKEITRISATQPFSFMVEYRHGEIGVGKPSSGYKVCGMPVTVVPWMKGILVVPKEF